MRTTVDRTRDELDEAFVELDARGSGFLERGRLHMDAQTAGAASCGCRSEYSAFVGSFLWFLPVLGLWFLPLGLLLIAQDVPFLRRPVGRMALYLLDRWKRLRKVVGSKKERTRETAA